MSEDSCGRKSRRCNTLQHARLHETKGPLMRASCSPVAAARRRAAVHVNQAASRICSEVLLERNSPSSIAASAFAMSINEARLSCSL
jgi:hypothetical protein